jgi:integrase
MAKHINRLTELRVKRALKGWHHDGGGLYLRVDSKSGRWWVFRYGAGGRRYLGLGPVGVVPLAEAREQARRCKRLLLAGTDPIAAGKAARAAAGNSKTFRQCALAYHEDHRVAWRSAQSAHDWLASVTTHAFPVLGDLPVAAIDTALVLQVIKPIWTDRYETASRLRGRIENVLDGAKVLGYRDGENPARWRGHLSHLLPKLDKARVKHHTALPYAEIAEFVSELQRLDTIETRALKFMILTTARAGEVCGAVWNEIDPAANFWSIPAARMKSGRAHRVPLSTAALDVLDRMPSDHGGRIFKLATSALRRTVKEIAGDKATVHGFRSSFRDFVGEQTGYAREMAEVALAHRVGDDTEEAYARGDLLEKRRAMMETWAEYCSGSNTRVARIRVAAHG